MKSFQGASGKQRVITVIREPGQLGSFGAHIGFAAKRAECRVLMIDLTRDGLMSRVLLPYDAAPGALSASQIFAVSFEGRAVELLCPGLSLVRSDTVVIDRSLTVIDAAAKLRRALAIFGDSFDICVIEAAEDVSVQSLAAMKISTNLFTTVCNVISTPTELKRHVQTVAELASAAAVEEPSPPQMLTVRLDHPITRNLDDADMQAVADRMVRAVIAEMKASGETHPA